MLEAGGGWNSGLVGSGALYGNCNARALVGFDFLIASQSPRRMRRVMNYCRWPVSASRAVTCAIAVSPPEPLQQSILRRT